MQQTSPATISRSLRPCAAMSRRSSDASCATSIIVIDSHFVLTVEKLQHKAEATIHVSGETIHAVASEGDMYVAIDALADKLERRVRKHKEKLTDHHAGQVQKSARP